MTPSVALLAGFDFPLQEMTAEIGAAAVDRLGAADGQAFAARVERLLPDLVDGLDDVYGQQTDMVAFIRSLLVVALDNAAARREPLRALDRQRETDPGWFQDPRVIAYVCYADRFAGTLDGVRSHLDYLAELGVSYLHLMPVLAPRDGENDGGYAVRDFDAVDPRIGEMADLSALSDELHRRDMTLCVDLVLNHTAKEHEWAQRALAGEEEYRNFYIVFPDRTMPDLYEQTAPHIFPGMTPGTFVHVPELGWVWATFREFQWDVNYGNPAVFRAMLDVLLRLANRGADILRLDAAPFLWKRLGTTCQDQPETHLLLQAFRALTTIAAPGVLLKAEAMLPPDLLGRYLGDHNPYRPECDMAYDNQLMVMLWSTLATGNTRLATQALSRRRPSPEPTTWATYIRCHDDIGWAVADTDAEAVGLDGGEHRRFLSNFYSGDVPGSFVRGARFQDSQVGEAPISGTAASLCGIEAALQSGDDEGLDLAIRRLETLYSVVFSFGGIPLLYMGDEIALLNDPNWEQDPDHRGDNRWMHRPPMDWTAAENRHDLSTVPGRVFARIAALAAARRSSPALRGSTETMVLGQANPAVFAYRRGRHQSLLAVANFTAVEQAVDLDLLSRARINQPEHVHSTTGTLDLRDGELMLPRYGFVWVRQQSAE